MPNQDQSNQQTDQSSASGVSNSYAGYVSPYSSQPPFTQVTSQGNNAVTPAQQQVQQPAPQVNPQNTPPTLQEYLAPDAQQTQQPIQEVANSDNLLDHPEEVEQILNQGEVVSTPQPIVINQPTNKPNISAQPPIANTVVQSNNYATPTVQEIPEYLADPAKAQAEVQAQLLKEKAELARKAVEEKEALKKAEEERLRKEQEALQIKAQQQMQTYQAPQKRPAPQINPTQRGKVMLDPARDLAAVIHAPGVDGDTGTKYQNITELLDLVIEKGASDLHLTVNYPPYIRIDDKLVEAGAYLSKEDVNAFISQSLSQNQKELLEVNREVDLSYQHKNKGRFRINAYYERGNLAAAYRLIPQQIRSVTELGLPGTLLDFARLSQGLFLVTGPTGSGKSTTLAGLIEHINQTSPKHIITIEDPIEYVYPKGMALVDQRELGGDTHDWSIALKSALRQDPDVILIGEMRDFDTIQSALTLAETGHLVFATLHTNSAAQSIDRIIDVFPPHQQQQVRTQLAGALKGILSQRLVPLIGGGRRAVYELLIVTPAVQNLIREGKTYQIDNVIATSADLGMSSLEKSLVKLIREGKVTSATAQDYAIRPEEILKLMKNNQI